MTHWTASPEADYAGEEKLPVAPTRIGPTSTIRGALTAGFAVVFVLWGASGYELVRSLREVDRRLEASRIDFQRGQDVLSTVRTNVLLGSIYLRDALIDRTPASDDDYRAALLKIRDDVRSGFAVVFVLWGASGYELVRSLREVDRRLEASRIDFQRGQDVLSTVRTNVLLGSIYLRDALIDRTPASDDDYRAALLKIRDDV